MITRIDRIQLAVADRAATAERWRSLLDAELVREDAVKALAARRTVLRVGASEVEILEEDGAGPVAEQLARSGAGLFAAGLAGPDLDALRARLDARSISWTAESGQLFVSSEALGIPGLRLVLSTDTPLEPCGLLGHLYEVTHLTPDSKGDGSRLAECFELDQQGFVPIASPQYGYSGTLTLFNADRLDRIETITPNDTSKTMGRFFDRRGPCLYMCFAEADDLSPLRERLLERAATGWTGPRDSASPASLFIHPPALGGVMLGVSRTTQAWTWSGHPDRVRSSDAAVDSI